MAEEVDQRKITEERLVEIARDGFDSDVPPTEAEIKAIADEVLYRRRRSRKDTRRAEEVKRLRWITETLVSKVEGLEARDAELEAKENDGG